MRPAHRPALGCTDHIGQKKQGITIRRHVPLANLSYRDLWALLSTATVLVLIAGQFQGLCPRRL
jgi:hypothetical protein